MGKKNEYDKMIAFLKKYKVDSQKARDELMDFYDDEMKRVFMDGYCKGLKQKKKRGK